MAAWRTVLVLGSLTHPEHPFPHGGGCHSPGLNTSKSCLPQDHDPKLPSPKGLQLLAAQTVFPEPLTLRHQVLSGSRRVHLKVSPRSRKGHGDGTDLSSRHFLFPSPQVCLCGIFIAMELGKLQSGACAVQDTSLFSLPCSAPYMNTFLLFFSLCIFFSLSHYPFNAEQGC